jgi:hypothetical protein
MTEAELLRIVSTVRQKVDMAKTQKAQLEGRWQEVTANLKSQFNVASLKEADALHTQMVAEAETAKAQAQNLLAELKEKHGAAIFA